MAAWIHRAADLIGGARSVPCALRSAAPDEAWVPHLFDGGRTLHLQQVEGTLADLLGIEYGTAQCFDLPLSLTRWGDAVADAAAIAARLHACAEKLAG
jgi:hypothetical protein